MTWDDGDYATAGDLWATVGERLVEDVGVAGLDVLDVATGTGMTAIAAARAGGRLRESCTRPAALRPWSTGTGSPCRRCSCDEQRSGRADSAGNGSSAWPSARPRPRRRQLVPLLVLAEVGLACPDVFEVVADVGVSDAVGSLRMSWGF